MDRPGTDSETVPDRAQSLPGVPLAAREQALEELRQELLVIDIELSTLANLKRHPDLENAAAVIGAWISRCRDDSLRREALVGLQSARARAALPWLVTLFDSHRFAKDRWLIGATLAVQLRTEDVAAIAPLVREPELGPARSELVAALSRCGLSPLTVPLLLECLPDPELVLAAIGSIGRLRARDALPELDALSRASWVATAYPRHPVELFSSGESWRDMIVREATAARLRCER